MDKYKLAAHGEFGAFIGDDLVIKIRGWDTHIVLLDRLSVLFGFQTTNPRVIINSNYDEWKLIHPLLNHLGDNANSQVHKVLVMDKLAGIPLCDTFSNTSTPSAFDIANPLFPSQIELQKIQNMCIGLGRMVVLDLIIRNNDRFNLMKFDAFLLATEKEKHAGLNWRYWAGNYGNIIVNTKSWHVNPIDSVYTVASNESEYSKNVAILLEYYQEEMAKELINSLSYNWIKTEHAKKSIIRGLNEGIYILENNFYTVIH